MKHPYKKVKRLLKQFSKKEIIDYAIVLYRKEYLEENDLDYTKLSEATLGLVFSTIGVNYNNMHPTKESKEKEDYEQWFRKIGLIPTAKEADHEAPA